MPDTGIIEITEPIDIKIVDDRVIFTCTSGKRQTTYSLSFHKCRNAAMVATALLNKHAAGCDGQILPFEKRAGH